MRFPILRILVAAIAVSITDPVVAQEKNPGAAVKLDLCGDPLSKGAVDRLGSIRLRHAVVKAVAFSPDGSPASD